MFSTVLYAADGSEEARNALRYAVDLARRYAARVIAVQAYQALPRDFAPLHRAELEARRQAAEALLRMVREELGRSNVPHDAVAEQGDAAAVILQVAERRGCDLIVMGARGVGRVSAALLGSVSQQVVQGARSPGLIVP